MGSAAMTKRQILVGDYIMTSYGTGPYWIKSITGPCQCASYEDHIDLGDRAPASEPHYHFTCADRMGKPFYLNGYTADGRSVWNSDTLTRVDTPAADVLAREIGDELLAEAEALGQQLETDGRTIEIVPPLVIPKELIQRLKVHSRSVIAALIRRTGCAVAVSPPLTVTPPSSAPEHGQLDLFRL
jgi:hypothetical protein